MEQAGKPAAKKGAESFRLLVQEVTDYAIFMLDPTGHILTWNAGAERLKQYRPDEIIGKHFSIFYPPDDLANGKPAREIRETLAGRRFEDEGWRLRKDGTRFWANVVLTALYDADGTLQGFAKITRDLTERRNAEDHLRQSETRLRLLIESIKDYAVFMLDPGGRIATWNAGAERIKGYKASEIIGKSLTVFYEEEEVRAGKCDTELATATATGRFEEEGWRRRKDGTRFWASVVISSIRDEHGTLVGFSKVTRDLTERKRVQEEQAARLAAEQANRAKDEFLAMLGHELRNPLAPIVTALQLLKLRADGALSKEHQVIERQVNHMVRLVDDLLDVSRITNGKIELKRQVHDLRDVVAKAIETVSPLLERKQHHFQVDVPQRELPVDGDEGRLVQVFANLLTNAAKYTDSGGHIFVKVGQADGSVVVEVCDDGVGIPSELLPQVFDAFVQGRQGAERAAGGLGLGLALVRTLLDLHGGTVEARSRGVGGGSTFTVRLPSVASRAAAPKQIGGAPVVGRADVSVKRRILVVDDNRDARELIKEVLETVGHEIRTAGDGLSAIEAAQAFKPEIAILDIGLPVMDGYELANRLRSEMGAATPRLIALTGYGQKSDHLRSHEAGFESHLVKPVDVQLLIDRISDGKA